MTVSGGRYLVGAGDWNAGVLVPVPYDRIRTLASRLVGDGDAATIEPEIGKYPVQHGIVGTRPTIVEAVFATSALELRRDREPSGYGTHAPGAGSITWRPTEGFRIDAPAVAGNRQSPDIRLVFGGAALFRGKVPTAPARRCGRSC